MTTKIRRYNERNLSPELQTPIILNDLVLSGGDLDPTGNTSIQLTGFRSLGYEKSINEALVWLLESFAGPTPPPKAVKGQLWYNTTDKLIYAYDGADYLNGGDSTLLTNWVKPIDIDISDLNAHLADFNNPHQVTKVQVGLGSVVDGLQLLAVNNFSDVPDKAIARNNLEVYSKDYIDANFVTIANGGDASTIGGISASSFVRSDINDDVNGILTFKNNTSIVTNYASGIPLTFSTGAVGDLGDVKVGFNKGKYASAITSGINFNELNTNTDKPNMFRLYRKTGTTGGDWNTTASIIGMVTESHDINEGGVYIGADGYSAANNAVLTFPKMLHVGINNLTWGSDLVVTDAGFSTRGDILPFDNSPGDASSGESLGSPTKYFRYTYSREVLSESIKDSSPIESSIPANSQIAFRVDNITDNKIRFASKDALTTYLGAFGGGMTDGVPIGTIMYYPSLNLPTGGYLFCDGATYTIAQYPDLYAVIGSTFNTQSTPVGSFNVPDLRGEFIRGFSNGRAGVDQGRALGSWQSDEIKSHTHTIGANNNGGVVGAIGTVATGSGVGHHPSTDASGGVESRPRNVALVPMIKALTGTGVSMTVVTQATEAISGIAKLATLSETIAGTDDTKIVTPLKLAAVASQATETTKGTAEIATLAETQAGTDDTRFVTPLKLASVTSQATETSKGTAELATTAEALAGTDDTRIITPLKLANVISAIPPAASIYMLTFQEQQTSGTDGGNFTSGAWRTRDLNTVVFNNIPSASLSSSQITLPAGTYEVISHCVGNSVNRHTSGLYNITDSAFTLYGSVENTNATTGMASSSIISGAFTISGTKVFELQHRCSDTKNTDGLGKSCNFGIPEVYSGITIKKIS